MKRTLGCLLLVCWGVMAGTATAAPAGSVVVPGVFEISTLKFTGDGSSMTSAGAICTGSGINVTGAAQYSIYGATTDATNSAGVYGTGPFVGVWGVGTGASGGTYGVAGTTSGSGTGVYGGSVNGFGVYGYSNTGAGVYASSSSGPALQAVGSAQITGNLGIGSNIPPTQTLSLGGQSPQTIWMERNGSGAGNSMTVQAGGASSGGSNQAGGDLILAPGIGTGSGGSGNTRIQTAGASATATADNQLVDRYIIVGKAKPMSLASPGFASLISLQIPTTGVAGGRIHYVVRATDGGSQVATESGVIQYLATQNSITCTVETTDKLHLGTVNSGCTPGFFNPGSQPGVSIYDNVSFSSPAPIVVHEVYYSIENQSGSPVRLEP